MKTKEQYGTTGETRTGGYTPIEDITPFGEELSEEQLQLVAGGRPCNCCGSSKVCDVGGGCWSDTDF